jgi:hypothetical protein
MYSLVNYGWLVVGVGGDKPVHSLRISGAQSRFFHTARNKSSNLVYKLQGLDTGLPTYLHSLFHYFTYCSALVFSIVLPIINSTYKYNNEVNINLLVT